MITTGIRLGWPVSRNVFGCECFCACNGTNALKFTVKERQIVSAFVKICFKFVGTKCEGLVGRTDTSKSEEKTEGDSSFAMMRMAR